MSYFVGLDVSLDETAICIVDDAGVIFREGKADTEPEAIATWLKAADVPIERLGLEAGPLSPWLCDGLQAAGLPAICIETRRMKGATAVMAVKTDRNDARAIAQAMRVGWFTAVHVKTAESELSPNFGDGLRVQAAAVWDFEDAGLAATSIPSVNLTP